MPQPTAFSLWPKHDKHGRWAGQQSMEFSVKCLRCSYPVKVRNQEDRTWRHKSKDCELGIIEVVLSFCKLPVAAELLDVSNPTWRSFCHGSAGFVKRLWTGSPLANQHAVAAQLDCPAIKISEGKCASSRQKNIYSRHYAFQSHLLTQRINKSHFLWLRGHITLKNSQSDLEAWPNIVASAWSQGHWDTWNDSSCWHYTAVHQWTQHRTPHRCFQHKSQASNALTILLPHSLTPSQALMTVVSAMNLVKDGLGKGFIGYDVNISSKCVVIWYVQYIWSGDIL